MCHFGSTHSPIEASPSSVPAPFSGHTLFLLELTIYMLATGAFASFGAISNVTNVLIFYRQGILSTSSTVHLTGLAVSDFFCCLTTLVRILALYFVYFSPGGASPSSAYSISLIVSAYVGPFIQMSCWVTAFTAFERVVCILFPLPVKSIFTPHRSLAVVVSIFLGTVILDTPSLFRSYLAWNISPDTNTSYIEIYYGRVFSPEVYKAWILTSPTILRFIAIFIVASCNVILFWKIKTSKKFREHFRALTPVSFQVESNDGLGKREVTSIKRESCDTKETSWKKSQHTKELKLLRMVVVISVMFTAGYTLCVPYTILFYYVWRHDVDYHFYHLYLGWILVNFFQTVNSSTNIIVFYKMSSRYKEDFKRLFACVRISKVFRIMPGRGATRRIQKLSKQTMNSQFG